MSKPRAEWFADIDRDATHYPWQPVLMEAESASVLTSCQTWFETEVQCLTFIRTYLVGAGLDRDLAP